MDIGVIIGVVLAVLVIAGLVIYNSLVTLRNKVKEAFATMDVYLQKRTDLVPNLVTIVKAYAKHEADTLVELTNKRTKAQGLGDTLNSETQIGNALANLIAVVESYPDLKANENFLDLQDKLVAIETDIASARRYYNGSVREFNDKCQMVPSNIVAALMHLKPMPSFEAGDEERKRPVF